MFVKVALLIVVVAVSNDAVAVAVGTALLSAVDVTLLL